MKTNVTFHKGERPSHENGPMRYVRIDEESYHNLVEKKTNCNRCIQFLRVLLYIELALFVGLLGCIILANYYVRNTDNNVSELYGNEGVRDYDDHDSLLIVHAKNSEDVARMRENSNDVSLDRSKTRRKSMIERKSDSGEMETSRPMTTMLTTTTMKTPAVTAVDNVDPNYTMKMWWFRKLNDNSPVHEDFSSDEVVSVKNGNEGAGSSPGKILMTKQFEGESTTPNYFSSFAGMSYSFPDTDSDDVYQQQFRQHTLRSSDYSDETPSLEKDFSQTDRLPDSRFDFEAADLMERLMSRRIRLKTALTVDSSSSSTAKTEDSARKVKRAADSSSSSSSSLDSSLNEVNETAVKDTEAGPNCPEIVDDKGNTIDDPKDTVNHVKRNWFNRILETPVPDCPENKSTKSVTLDDYGKFSIMCIPEVALNDPTDESTEAETKNRDVKSFDADKNVEDKCLELFNTARDNVIKITNELVPGKNSDADIEELRSIFMGGVTIFVVQAVAAHTIVGISLSNQRIWEGIMSDLRQNLTVIAKPEHRTLIHPDTPHMANDLRKIVDSAIALHQTCRDSVTNVDLAMRHLRSIMLNIEHGICSMRWEMIEKKQKSLVNGLVTGVPPDDFLDINDRFQSRIYSIVRTIAHLEGHDSAVAQISHLDIDDKQWRNMLIEFRMSLETAFKDQITRERIRNGNPPTEQQAKDLRDIVNYYLCHYSKCRALEGKFETRYDENQVSREPEEIETNSRARRSVKFDSEECAAMSNSTGTNLRKLEKHIVPGADSDAETKRLRGIFEDNLVFFALRVIAMNSNDGFKTDRKMSEGVMVDLRENITKSADTEHRVLIKQVGPTTSQMVDDLRNIIISIADFYDICRNVTDNTAMVKQQLMGMTATIEHIKCPVMWQLMQKKQNSLTNEMVYYESLEKKVDKLRRRFKRMIFLMARSLARLEKEDSKKFSTGRLNITDESLRNMLIELKTKIANDSEAFGIPQQLLNSKPPTEKQIKEFYDIMEYYLHDYRQCRALEGLPDDFEKGYSEGDHACPKFSKGCNPAAKQIETTQA